jgi:Holliday junction resolvase RusA-like endonuclease
MNVRCNVTIDLDDKRNGDADNRAKPVLDLLVKYEIIKNDSKKYVKRVSIGWEPIEGCRVRIEPA